MADVDYDKLSDEEFEDLLDNIDDVDAEDAANFEDTDQTEIDSDSEEEETETNQNDDDDFDDTDDDSKEDDDDWNEENTHAEEEDDNDSSESNEDDSIEAGSEPEEDESADIKDPDAMTNEEKIDYKKAYEEAMAEKTKFEDFYNQTTGEFVANGKTMRAPNDPKKIVQALQKAVGFDGKMKAFKKYRPFTSALEEKGFLDNPEKFNLMINAMEGDKEAIKKLISNAEIDPVELDMENIDYKSKSVLPTNMEMAYGDVIDSATQYGVKEQVEKVISADWDDESVIELLEDPKNSADLVKHLSTGVYDMVQERIAQKRMVDADGTYGSMKAIEQYRNAAQELELEYKQFLKQQQEQNVHQQEPMQDNGYGSEEAQFSEEEIQAEIERIKQEKTYSQKVNKRNAEADAGRKRAASISKKKPRSKKKSNDFDPAKLSDDEFSAYLDSMIYS